MKKSRTFGVIVKKPRKGAIPGPPLKPYLNDPRKYRVRIPITNIQENSLINNPFVFWFLWVTTLSLSILFIGHTLNHP